MTKYPPRTVVESAEVELRTKLPDEVKLAMAVINQAKIDLIGGDEASFKDAARWSFLHDTGVMSLAYYCSFLHVPTDRVRERLHDCIPVERREEAFNALL